MRDIRSEVEDEQYEWLTSLKSYFGYTWKGLILEGAKELDTLEMDTSQTVYASNSPQPGDNGPDFGPIYLTEESKATLAGMETEAEFDEALNTELNKLLREAAERARDNDRRTLRPEDLLGRES